MRIVFHRSPIVSGILVEDEDEWGQFTSADTGSVRPFQIDISGLSSKITIDSVTVRNCNTGQSIKLADSLTTWSLDSLFLNSIGITSWSLGRCLAVDVHVAANCNAVTMPGDTIIMPVITISMVTYCGDTIGRSARTPQDQNLAGWTEWTGISHCTNCYSITKTALQDTVIAGDSVQFQIVITSFNADSSWVQFQDWLPQNFTLTSTLPDSLHLPPIGSDTLIAEGFYTLSGSCSDSAMVNTATIYFNGDSLSGQDCIHVYASCAALADTIIADSSFASSFPGGFIGQNVYLDGRFYIDVNTFTIQNSHVWVNTAGQIIVLNGNSLQVENSTIEGCDMMWQGMYLESNTALAVEENSVIRDANKAIYANDRTELKLLNSSFEDNVWSLYVPYNPGLNNIAMNITGNRIGMFAPFLKPGYPGQQPFGTKPYCGMELNDVVNQIGFSTADSNWFYNMNAGILGFRSRFVVENDKFQDIWPDTTYQNSWDGSAIYSGGDQPFGIQASLEVRPLDSGASTMDSCQRGIHTDYSALTARALKMSNMETGIRSLNCTDMLFTNVQLCQIEANLFGIDWLMNNGSSAMLAENNEITVQGAHSFGIAIREVNNSATANYKVKSNNIDVTDGECGILAQSLLKASIESNIISLSKNGSNFLRGIVLQGSPENRVNCNAIKGNSVTDTLLQGLAVEQSERCNISCNTTDSTGWGIFFGGICTQTVFDGNIMHDHFEGLRLNNVAVIDTHSFAGNRWTGSYGNNGWGAVNMNADSAQAVASSLFAVNPSLDPSLLPSFPTTSGPAWPDDNGWFVIFTSGTNFVCSDSSFCEDSRSRRTSESLRISIADDSTLTTEYIPESKSVAKEMLYQELATDFSSIIGNSALVDFYNNSMNSSIGKLQASKTAVGQSQTLDNITAENKQSIEESVMVLQGDIRTLDSLWMVFTTSENITTRQHLVDSMIVQRNQIASILAFHAIAQDSLLMVSANKNSQVQPIEDPEINQKVINSAEIAFRSDGRTSLNQFTAQLISVATQCPYKGGPAVYRARTLLEFLDMSFSYDDLTTCSTLGVFRSSVNQQANRSNIQIHPNPASNIITIAFHNKISSKYHLSVIDSKSRHVFTTVSGKSEFQLDISSFSSGVYSVQIIYDNNVWVKRFVKLP